MEKEKQTERCCGECCWFCFEQTDGWGQCLRQELCDSMNCSDLCTTDEYVSRKEMRHHMAVLLQVGRWQQNPEIRHMPTPKEYIEAVRFAYRYMKIFSQL